MSSDSFKSIEDMSLYKMLLDLWRKIELKHRRQLVGLFFLMIVAAFAEILTIGALVPLLAVLSSQEIVVSNPLAMFFIELIQLKKQIQVGTLVMVFAFAALFAGGVRLLLLWMQTHLSHAIGVTLSAEIYKRTLYQPYAVHTKQNSSEVISLVVHKANVVVGNILVPCIVILSSFLLLIGVLSTLVLVDPEIAIASVIGFGGIYAIVIRLTRKRIQFHSERVRKEEARVIKLLQEGLGCIRDVIMGGAQNSYINYYKSADVPLRKSLASIQFISQSPRYGVEALGMMLIASLAFILTGRPEGAIGALPILGALALGAQRMLPVLQQSYSAWTGIRGGQATLREVITLLNKPVLTCFDLHTAKSMKFEREIKLHEISFEYSYGVRVLQSVNLVVPKGVRVGIIGSTGSGKSTLIDVIMGLLSPTSGVIFIDGVRLNEGNQRAWQSNISHVPQSIFLVDESIAQNIALGVPLENINMDLVRRVAKLAQISETIENWSEKYETLVGERGIRLSGGQRQRIGIARALYKRNDVIVFDEATSALDNATENSIIEAINNIDRNITIFMIAHRLTTLKDCDLIIELENGRIKRKGTYSEIVLNQELNSSLQLV